jgi:hypothetical protein
MTDVTLTIRRLGALDGRSPEQVRPTDHNAWGQLPTATLQARLTESALPPKADMIDNCGMPARDQ